MSNGLAVCTHTRINEFAPETRRTICVTLLYAAVQHFNGKHDCIVVHCSAVSFETSNSHLVKKINKSTCSFAKVYYLATFVILVP